MIQYGNLNRMLPLLENLLTHTKGQGAKKPGANVEIERLQKTAL
jgi:Fe-S protein, radical SAM family